MSDAQFLEVPGPDGPATNRVACDLLQLEQSLIDGHVAGIFSQPKDSGHVKSQGLDTWSALRHVTQLLGPGCSGEC